MVVKTIIWFIGVVSAITLALQIVIVIHILNNYNVSRIDQRIIENTSLSNNASKRIPSILENKLLVKISEDLQKHPSRHRRHSATHCEHCQKTKHHNVQNVTYVQQALAKCSSSRKWYLMSQKSCCDLWQKASRYYYSVYDPNNGSHKWIVDIFNMIPNDVSNICGQVAPLWFGYYEQNVREIKSLLLDILNNRNVKNKQNKIHSFSNIDEECVCKSYMGYPSIRGWMGWKNF